MPYTFAHIGYIIPLKKKWTTKLSITGLVFGSIVPDFDILFRLSNIRYHIFQYNLKTICLLILPLGLISAFIFHLFCRNIIIENLPETYERKYTKYKTFDFVLYFKNHYLIVVSSIFLSILLHLLLDFLCHFINAYYIKMFVLSITKNNFIVNASYIVSIYGLPIIFSILGFYLIYVFEFHRKISLIDLRLTKTKFIFWLSMFVCTIFFSVIKFYITEIDEEFFFDYIIISLTSTFLVAIYATSIVYYFIQKFRAI